MARFLIISTFEVYPLGGLLSGPAIRTLEIARALHRLGHDIVLAQPHRLPDHREYDDPFQVVKWDESNVYDLCHATDACLIPHYIAETLFRRLVNVPVIVDLFDPEFMAILQSDELFHNPEDHFKDLNQVRLNLDSALLNGDLFICATDRQRDYYSGMLTLSGRITPEFPPEELLALVPTGVPTLPPQRKEGLVLFRGGGVIPDDWYIILCPGGLYPWFDPEPPILALERLLSRGIQAALVFVGAENPITPGFSVIGAAKAKELASEKGLLNRRVFFHSWVAYEDRAVIYLDADLAVITSKPFAETTYSARNRMIDCLWGGLPVVCTAGDSLGEIVQAAEAGATVPAKDPEALTEAISRLLLDGKAREAASQKASALARERFSWEKCVEPLHHFLKGLTEAKGEDKRPPASGRRPALVFDMKRQQKLLDDKEYLEARVADAETELNATQSELGQVRNRLEETEKDLTHDQRSLIRSAGRLELASETIRRLALEVETQRDRAEQAEALLSYIYSGRGWKFLKGYYRLRDRLLAPSRKVRAGVRYLSNHGVREAVRRALRGPLTVDAPALIEQYRSLLKNLGRRNALEMAKAVGAWSHLPLISVVTPVYNTNSKHLSQAIESVIRQAYPHWELCIVDDGSTREEVRRILKEAVSRDARIRCRFHRENQGIVGASNSALEMCRGEFVGFLDHDDVLEEDALWEIVRLLQEEPDADVIYTDEDKIDEAGNPVEVFFRPDWSPEFLLSTMYMVHFNVLRRSLLRQINGFREGFTISQDYDLILRATEKTDKVYHIPRVLYHWRKHEDSRSSQNRAMEDTVRLSTKALSDALERRNVPGRVENGAFFNFFRVRYGIKGYPMVSVIIPTRDRLLMLETCLSSLVEKTGWANYEIIVVDNQSACPTRSYLKYSHVRLLRAPYPFSFSRMMNHAAQAARGDYLLFLNNDTKVVEPQWMESLLEQAQMEDVGAAGGKLIYDNATVQHAGVVLGLSHNEVAGHIFHGFPSGNPGYQGWLNTVRNVSAVTAACMMTRRKLFLDLGGFELKLGVAFQDVDYCLRLQQAGYRVVYTPYSCMVHYESISRGHTSDRKEEVHFMLERWGDKIANDPFYNPNLTLSRPDATLRQ